MMTSNVKWTMDSHTLMFGVFGDPIRHSKSPIMMNRAFRETGINAAYAAFQIAPERLEQAVHGIRAMQFRGVNVTIPHKVEIMKYLDRIDEAANVIGAVNTIVNDNGILTGYNTDGIGYVRSLKEETGLDLRAKRVLIVGAGGAARGVGYALSKEKPETIYIANRTAGKAAELAEALSAYVTCEGMGLTDIGDVAPQIDIVVNTTSSGMHPNVGEVPIDTSWFHEGLTVSDLIYNPMKTRMLKDAESKGARIHGGLGMFIYQGAYAFEYWTGKTAPAAVMREVVEQSLQPIPN